VTYFDEGIYSSRSPLSNEGINAFSLRGKYLGGYRSSLSQFAVDVSDCYSACLDEDGQLLFSPYTDFPLVRLQLPSWRQVVWELPKILHACSNIAALNNQVYFWNPGYDRTDQIYSFDLESKQVWEVGSFPFGRSSLYRGVLQGRFLEVNGSNLYLIDPSS
jgi:hypothetical protein